MLKKVTMDATSTAVSWAPIIGDGRDYKRITFNFAVAPTTSENLVITVDAYEGAAYDEVLMEIDAVGETCIVIEGIDAIAFNDSLKFEYTNTDTVSITAVITYELTP